jgi:hypothetical protein
MTPNQAHIAGLELARTELPKTSTRNYLLALDELIEQAKAAPEPVQGEAVATYMGTDWDASRQFMAQCAHLETGAELYTAPQAPDAELVDLLRQWSAMFSGGLAAGPLLSLREHTDAKLASLRKGES